MTDWFEHWAREAPERVFIAQRAPGFGPWRKVSYAEAFARARSVAQALIDRKLNVERPVAILSGNSIDHALIGLGAMIAGVPYAPVSPPYSLVAKDFAKLTAIVKILTPGLVFVDDAAPFARAIETVLPEETEVVAGANAPRRARAATLESIYATPSSPAVDAAHARVTPDTIGKFLFTSGSTGTPKGVINTQGMMTSNQAMLKAFNPSHSEEPPVLLDWLPWSHTFGGNNNFNLVLANGGTLYIDEGRPLPQAIETTVKNLKEISPTIYYNVPKGFEMLLPFAQEDEAVRRGLFARLQSFCYAGAALSPYLRAEYERLGLETTGVAIPMLTSFGSTETGPSALSLSAKSCKPSVIGIPNPGVEIKLIPNAGKLEARVKSPSVTPRLLASTRSHGQGFRRGRLLQVRRRAEVLQRERSRGGLSVRRPSRRGFQARDRNLGQRRPAAAAVHFAFRALCHRPHRRGPGSRRRDRAGGAQLRRLPRARSGLARRSEPCRDRRERTCARTVRGAPRRIQSIGRRQFGAVQANPPSVRPALARQRRTHRQRLHQSARRARAAPV